MDDGMFGERAYLYDLIYDSKDYAMESRTLRGVLETRGLEEGARVLEAACGTGAYLEYLREWCEVSGFDISPDMIDIAADRVEDVRLFVADMRDFEVAEPFDAVVCLFSSIGYVHGTDGLADVCRSFADALGPGGVVVIEPWVGPDDLEDGNVWMQTYEDEDIKVCRQLMPARDDRVAVLDFHWLVARKSDGIDHFTDLHELYMYTHEEYVDALEGARFEVEHDDEGLTGRGLYIGVLQEG
ncbi:MAG: class I SAM-dependent DNA methyltransferase [Myxococcota bacterium]